MEEVKSGSCDGDVNLGIFDSHVPHEDVNRTLNVADNFILLGEQNRLPYFPDVQRLRKLRAADPLVLFTWKVLKKIPQNFRDALIDEPINLTLVPGDDLLYFSDYRCHQALHIGRQRQTIYLSELLFQAAENKGYNHWAIVEGLIYSGWMLLDYLLMLDVLRSYQSLVRSTPGRRLNVSLLQTLVEDYNPHRREHVDEGCSEVVEFVDRYKSSLVRIEPEEAAETDPVELAREVAERQRLDTTPQSFADLLHDYRDSLRFDDDPLMTMFGKGVVPKPRVTFLEQVVQLGACGLRGFFVAYRTAEQDVVDLMHPLWMFLCSFSSDPAGVFSRVGRCRSLERLGQEEGVDGPLAGIMLRLDRAENYGDMIVEVAAMEVAARQELNGLIENQSLQEEDKWEVFKSRKQTIVTRAAEALNRIDGTDVDRSEHQSHLLKSVRQLGILAFSVLHNIFENVPEHNAGRHGILMPACYPATYVGTITKAVGSEQSGE